MHVDNVAGQAAAYKHQQTQAADRAREKADDKETAGEVRSARAEENARSDEPSRARQTAPSQSADADRPEPERSREGGVDIRV